MSASVGDFRLRAKAPEKIKKADSHLTLTLEKTTDILAELGMVKGERLLIGFAAETQNIVEYAQRKLTQKNLDMIVANDITKEGAGFGVDTNIVKIIDHFGKVEDLPLMSKLELIRMILDRIKELKL